MNREKEIVKTSLLGIFTNVALVAIKVIVGIFSLSISLILDGVNNLTDVVSSVVTIIGTKLSNKKPDKKHPYGHGRVEFITSSIVGIIIFIAGALAIYEAIMSLIRQEAPSYLTITFILIPIAIVAKIAIGIIYRIQGKKLNSDTLKASGLDALMDSILSLGTLIGAIISVTTGVHLEGYIGIVIGVFIIKTSIDVIRESISKIIGERIDKSTAQEFIQDVNKFPNVLGAFDLIVNNYGHDRSIGSVHIEVKDDMTAKEIQQLSREIQTFAFLKYKMILTVGIYASNSLNEQEKKIKEDIFKIVLSHEGVVQIHGFYVDLTNKNISFDIVFDISNPHPEDMYNHVYNEIKELYKDYNVQITLDTDFSLT